MLSLKYNLILQECCLARSSLLNGLNAILKSNITDVDKGNFYVGMFQLSIGIERILKLTIIMDYLCQNNLVMLSGNILKGKYGHGIKMLYEDCRLISCKYKKREEFISSDNSIYDTLVVLDGFAKNTRYYNLDTLSNNDSGTDPLSDWMGKVITPIIENNISSSVKDKLKIKVFKCLNENFGNRITNQIDYTGQIITRFDVLLNSELIKKANYYINWNTEYVNIVYANF